MIAKKISFLSFGAGALLSFLMVLIIPLQMFAASLTAMSDTLSTQKASDTANHRVVFTSTSGISSGTITVDFSNAVSSTGSVNETDIDLSYGTTGTETNATLASDAASGVWGAAIASKVLTLTYPTSGGTAIGAGDKVIVKIGTNASGGDAQMTNTTSGNSKVITITAGSDSGKLAIALVDDSSVGTTSDVAFPTAPSGLSAAAVSSTHVTLTWTDTSSNETGFFIERSPASGGSYTQVGTTGPGVTTYEDTTASAGTPYLYRVRMFNGVDYSTYSTAATVTTPSAGVAVIGAPSSTSSSSNNSNTSGNQSSETPSEPLFTPVPSAEVPSDATPCMVSCRLGCPCSTTDALGNTSSGSTGTTTGDGSTSTGTQGTTTGTGTTAGGSSSGSSSATAVNFTPTIATIDSAGDVGEYSSFKLAPDGFGRIAYYDGTNSALKFALCLNADCSKSKISVVDSTGDVGSYVSMELGPDGFGRIAYYDATNSALKFALCLNADCSKSTIKTLDLKGNVGTDASLALNSDNVPLIAYYDGTNKTVKYCQCHDIECTTYNIITIDLGDGEPDGPAISLVKSASSAGPVITFKKTIEGLVRTVQVQCNDLACDPKGPTPPTVIVLPTRGDGFVIMGADGFPRIVYEEAGTVHYLQCKDVACDPTGSNPPIDTVIDAGGDMTLPIMDEFPPITSPGDFPKFTYYKDGQLNYVICTDLPCQKKVITVIQYTGKIGKKSIDLTNNDVPEFTFYDETNEDLKLIECKNETCSNEPIAATADSDTPSVPPVTNIGMSSTGEFITNPLVWHVSMSSGGDAPYNGGTFCSKVKTNFVPCIPLGAFPRPVNHTSINLAGATYPLTFDEQNQCYTGALGVPDVLGSYIMSLRTTYIDGTTSLVDSELSVRDSCADFVLAAMSPNPFGLSQVTEQLQTIQDQTGGIVKKSQGALEITSIILTSSIIALAPSVVSNLPNAYQYVYQGTSSIFSLFGYKKRRRKKWGIVYDAYSKEPESLAIVRLYDAVTKKLLETQVTDKTGRFSFITQAGKYVVKVSKAPFGFPSNVVKGNTDGGYGNIYRGGEIRLASDKDEISISIPIDPKKRSLIKEGSFLSALLDELEKVGPYIAVISFVISLALVVYTPNWLNTAIFILNSVLVLLQFLVVPRIRTSWGIVFDDSTLKPLSLATISLFDAGSNKLVRSRLTDPQGRFNFLAPAGHYKILVSRSNYDSVTKATKKVTQYRHLYFGEEIRVKKNNGTVRVNIPMHRRPLA